MQNAIFQSDFGLLILKTFMSVTLSKGTIIFQALLPAILQS